IRARNVTGVQTCALPIFYGLEEGVIDGRTPLHPKSNYGKSKLEAENLIQPLENKNFKVAIIRPPMIYGKDCKGNYQRLAKIAKRSEERRVGKECRCRWEA